MYRQGIGKFLPEDIDPTLCTHVIFAFVDIVNGRELRPADPNDLPKPGNKGMMRFLLDNQWFLVGYNV